MRDWIKKYQYRTDKDPIKPAPKKKTDENDDTTTTTTRTKKDRETVTKPGFKSGVASKGGGTTQQGQPDEDFRSKNY